MAKPRKPAAAVPRVDSRLDTRESIRWYVKVMKGFAGSMHDIKEERIGKLVSIPNIGKMCAYWYDPKTKDELPYWDKFPLVLPIEWYNNGILGLNLHYLAPGERQGLLEAMMKVSSRKDLTKDAQIMLTYGMLKETTRFPGWEPCIKRYLASHFRSPILEIDPLSWRLAVALPTQVFVPRRPW